MSSNHIKDRIKELAGLINNHNKKYYLNDNPEITDAEFDLLLNELIELEKKNPKLNFQIPQLIRLVAIFRKIFLNINIKNQCTV